jgi:hypothetical protein
MTMADEKIIPDAMPNTTGVIETLESGRIEEIETLLGPVFRLPRAGVIRPGIMVLKGRCSQQDHMLYDDLVNQGLDWDEIDQRLGKDVGGRSKLIPYNVDYFTIRPEDCQNPQNVETIYRLYADPDGKLRSFPVWFATNEWWNIIPHSLRCFGKQQGLRFQSFFKDSERWCKFPAPVTAGKKTFGGRSWGERSCNPDSCEEFQSGECKFGGVIQFYIPGTKGIGIWIIPTTSWRSLSSIKSSLEAFYVLTGGRIAGLFNMPDESGVIVPRPIFRISKRLETVYPTDSNGTVTKRSQWIISLDVDVDLTEVLRQSSPQKVIARGRSAAQTLNGAVEKGKEQGEDTNTQPVSEKSERERLSAIMEAEQNHQPSNNDKPDKPDKPATNTTPESEAPVKTPVKTTDNRPMTLQQAAAIKKIAAIKGIDKSAVEAKIKGLSMEQAAKLIQTIQKEGSLNADVVSKSDGIPKEETVEEEF